nr:MAG TPA: hypothetical protein [Bacteriophage sp.]
MDIKTTGTLADRLKAVMAEKEIGVSDLAKLSGVDKAAISRYLKGAYLPKQHNLSKLSRVLRVDEGWLISGVLQKNSPYDNAPITATAFRYPFIPTEISAGKLESVEASTDLPYITVPNVLLGKYARRKDLYFMRVNGESMNRVIPNHSLVAVVSPVDKCALNNGDIVVASNNGAYAIKRFINDLENKRIILRPDSSDIAFSDIVIPYESADNLQIFGKVVIYSVVL